MRGFSSSVLSCLERERLEEEFFEARTRGRNLSRLRQLTHRERMALDEREQTAQAQGPRRGARLSTVTWHLRRFGAAFKRDGEKMNRVVSSTLRYIQGQRRCAFPA